MGKSSEKKKIELSKFIDPDRKECIGTCFACLPECPVHEIKKEKAKEQKKQSIKTDKS